MKKYLLLCLIVTALRADSQQLLDAEAHPKFVNSLPILQRVDATLPGTSMEVRMEEFTQDLGLVDMNGTPLHTKLWGYNFGDGPTYPGKTIEAKVNVPLEVNWINGLTNGFLFPVDTTVVWAFSHMPGVWNPDTRTPVPAVVHLHGGHTASASDGLGDAWYTPGNTYTGMDFSPQPFHYDNVQRGGMLWYHDHVIGTNRLSIYSGLIGSYILRDDYENSLIDAGQLPAGPYEIELMIQDKMFTTDGEMYFPSEPEEAGQPAVSILPEFFGDFILVNGKAWPKLQVEPRPYRFRIVNASDSRFYNLSLFNKGKIILIGKGGGFLQEPVVVKDFVLGPAQRADIIIDFSDLEGQIIIVKNDARSPFPSGDPIDHKTTGLIMAFEVNLPLEASVLKAALPGSFSGFPTVPTASASRQLLLFEAMDEYGRLKPSLGTVTTGVLGMEDPVTETPVLGTTEMWEVFNATEDAHPIHLHLVQFYVVSTQRFTADVDETTGALSNIVMKGPVRTPSVRGWEDTAPMLPGEVTRIVATFDRAGKYTWHCHILSHADHEMMRPFVVVESTRQSRNNLVQEGNMLHQNFPNPFDASTRIQFDLRKDDYVNLAIYNLNGEKLAELINQYLPAGLHNVDVFADALSSGIYYYTLQTGDQKEMKRMQVIKQ